MINDIPTNAEKYSGKEVRKILNTLREKDIAFYEKTNRCINGGQEFLKKFGAIESGDGWSIDFKMTSEESKEYFNGKLSPTIDGVRYYRGIAIPRKNGTILLYTPMMQPWIPEQRKETFDLWTSGDVSNEEIKEVIGTYATGMNKHIDRILERIRACKDGSEGLSLFDSIDN